MFALALLLAQAAPSTAVEARPVKLVIVVGEGVVTEEYPTLEACEAARSRLIAYNRRRTDEELKRDRSDRLNHAAFAAACAPL